MKVTGGKSLCEHSSKIQQAPQHFTPCKGTSQFMTDYCKTPLPQQTRGTRHKTIPELPLLSDSIALIAGIISWTLAILGCLTALI